MVDVDTALRASAYNDRKRKSNGERDGGKPTSKKIEPFDPLMHSIKELADAYSMWLVIIYGVAVAAGIRYLLMPRIEGDPSSGGDLTSDHTASNDGAYLWGDFNCWVQYPTLEEREAFIEIIENDFFISLKDREDELKKREAALLEIQENTNEYWKREKRHY